MFVNAERQNYAQKSKASGNSAGGLKTKFERKLLRFYEDDEQRVECERLDQRQTENQHQLNRRASSGVTRHSFGSRSGGLALAEAAKTRGDRHCDTGANGCPVGGDGCSALLGECRH